jgi:hypothetical protein
VADIPIQRKEGRNIWPLLLGLVVLAAVLWFVFARQRGPDTAAARADSAAVAAPAVRTDCAVGTTGAPPAATTRRTDSTSRP